MINLKIYNALSEQISSIDNGSVSYPYSVEQQLILTNEGTYKALRVTVEICKGVSVTNYSSPDMIRDAQIEVPGVYPPMEYYEFVVPENKYVIDISNFPGKRREVTLDIDGYNRTLIPGVKIAFNHIQKNANSGLYISEAFYMAGVSLDSGGTATGYKNKISFQEISIGESVVFWYKFFLRNNMEAQKNPRVFNLVVRGEEDR